MGLADRDYMRERARERIRNQDDPKPNPVLFAAVLIPCVAVTHLAVRAYGFWAVMPWLLALIAASVLFKRYVLGTSWETLLRGNKSHDPAALTAQFRIIGVAGALVPVLIFLGLKSSLVPTSAQIESEHARREQALIATREAPVDSSGRRQIQQGIAGVEGGKPWTQKVPETRKAPTRFVTADQLPAKLTVALTGDGTIHLVDLTGTSDYKVLQLRSLYNEKLVGTAIVRPGENMRIKVPYEHPFRVTAITSAAMPKSWDGLKTSTVTVDLGTVLAMPNRPGIVAMGAVGQPMRVIPDSQF